MKYRVPYSPISLPLDVQATMGGRMQLLFYHKIIQVPKLTRKTHSKKPALISSLLSISPYTVRELGIVDPISMMCEVWNMLEHHHCNDAIGAQCMT